MTDISDVTCFEIDGNTDDSNNFSLDESCFTDAFLNNSASFVQNFDKNMFCHLSTIQLLLAIYTFSK